MVWVYVQLTNNPNTLKLKAEKVEEDGVNNKLLAKDAKGAVIGKFDMNSVAGWWTEPYVS
jgi:hypothetical protein